MEMSAMGLFRAKWTDRIHGEWISNLLINRPDLTRQKLERTRDLMNEALADCLVSGYEPLIAGLDLPDEKRPSRFSSSHSLQCGCNNNLQFKGFSAR
jgi:hypothetical protein